MLRVLSVACAVLVFVGLGFAQNDSMLAAAGDKYLISARAGGVNLVDGTVGVVRDAGVSGRLVKGDRLEIGDRVSTGAGAKAEVLLNPGSFLRLAPLSAFEFESTSLDDLRVRLDSGSAIFEVFATTDFVVTVMTPKGKFVLIDSGVYRIDVAADGLATVEVWKGKAQVGDDRNAVVKSGRRAASVSGSVTVAKFDRGSKDEFERWSQSRAKELADITGRLERNAMRTALMRSYLGRQWNVFDSFGLWVYDPFRRSHCFLPFGWGWGSPYGYGFGSNIWYYNLPGVVFTPPSGGGNPVSPVLTVKPGRIHQEPVRPPYAQVQGSSGPTGSDFRTFKPGRTADIDTSMNSEPIRSSGGGFSAPSSASPSSAPPVMDTKPGRP